MCVRKNPTRRYRVIPWVWIGLGTLVGFILLMIPLSWLPPYLSEVEKLVGRSSNIFALRFPETPEKAEEFIVARLTYGYGQTDENVRLIRYVITRESEGTFVEITQEAWRPIYALVREWCYHPSTLPNIAEKAPFCDVGYRCGGYKRVKIPVDELPPELVMLIETVPSPTCDDPFCGWREEITNPGIPDAADSTGLTAPDETLETAPSVPDAESTPRGRTGFMDIWIVGGVLMVALYYAITLVDGWQPLAAHYRLRGKPPPRQRWFVAGTVGEIYYWWSLAVKVTPDGLYLSPLSFWWLWHPPLLIPWENIVATYQETRNDSYTRLTIAQVEQSPILLPTSVLEPALTNFWCPPPQAGSTRLQIYGMRVVLVMVGGSCLLMGVLWLLLTIR